MFQSRILAALVVAMAFSTAHAQNVSDAKSEFFYQPMAGQSAVSAKLGYSSNATRVKNGTVDAKESGLDPFALRYEYGLNEMFSLGLELGYVSTTRDFGAGGYNPKTSGLKDPTIMLHGTSLMGFGHLRYGADLGVALGKVKVETNNDYGAGTGGLSLNPYVGADMMAGPGLLGARLNYRIAMERTYDAPGGDQKFSGGNTLGISVFYEYMLSDMLLGAELDYTSNSELKKTSPSPETVVSKMFSPIGIDLYARIPAMPGLDIIPRLAYGFSAGGDQYDKYNVMNLSIAGRYEF